MCAPTKTEDLNVHVFNMVTWMKESKILTRQVACKCKCKFNGGSVIQIKSGIKINVEV